MDSYVQGWRAVIWGRVWAAVVVLTFAWSIGVGMALRAVSPRYSVRGDCLPTAVQPLAKTPADWLMLPLHAAIAVPFGLYLSGLQFALAALIVAVIPAALLPQGTARRVLSAPVLATLAVLLILAGWSHELATIAASGLPQIACSASGY